MLRGLLLTAVSAGALWAPPSASAVLTSAYDFRAGSLAASYGGQGGSNAPPLKGEGTSSSTFAAGDGYVVPLGVGVPATDWTLAAVVELDSLVGEQRILDLVAGQDDSGLWLRDDRLEWRSGRDTQVTDAVLQAGTPTHLVVVRDDTEVRVHVEGEVVLTLATPSGSFIDPGNGFRLFGADGPAGRLHRLRLVAEGLSVAEVDALSRLDERAPTEVSVMHGTFGTHVEDGTLWAGPRGWIEITAFDDGTGPLQVVEHGVFAEGPPTMLLAAGPDPGGVASAWDVERIRSRIDVPFDTRSLADGGRFRFAGKLVDALGHATPFERELRVDRSPPAGLTVEAPGETAVAVPSFGGAAATGPRDAPSVFVVVCRGTTCDDEEGDEVGIAGSEVIGGRWRSGELTTWPEGEPEPVRVPSLAPGTYVVQASQSDWLGNTTTTEAVFRAEGRVRREPPPAAGGPPAVDPGPSTRGTLPPRLLTPAALLARNRMSVIAALLREGLRGLTRDGRAVVGVSTDRPAGVVVQLYDGTAPKTVDPKAKASDRAGRLVATGRRTLAGPGTGRVTVRVTRRGRSLLKGSRSRRLAVRTIVTPRGGRPVADTRRITLRR